MKADVHPRQAERLAALRSYRVLDTEPEEAFDEIAALAAQICGKKFAVVNLIDAERQFFKAEVGFGVRELPLDDAICAHVILEGDFTLIHDTLKHPRLKDNPLCLGEPNLRFYAGALLTSDTGLPIGTLCVLDDRPGDLDETQKFALQVLARQVMAQLDLRRELRRAEVLRREVDHRVKNTLQSVASLTRMQGRVSATPEAREMVDVVSRRIETVAKLNDHLYRSDADQEVPLSDFLGSVVALVDDCAPHGVTVEGVFDAVSVPAPIAGSLAMIVNEFSTNSFKHAFPDDAEGRVTVECRSLGAERLQLTCADDGVGMAVGASETGLGMTILANAVEQLDGRLERLDVTRGHALRVTFPI